jgi:hypothetical protein
MGWDRRPVPVPIVHRDRDFDARLYDGTDAWAVSSPQEVIDGFAARLRLTLQQAGAAEAALPPRVTTAFWDRRFRDTRTLPPVSKAPATG